MGEIQGTPAIVCVRSGKQCWEFSRWNTILWVSTAPVPQTEARVLAFWRYCWFRCRVKQKFCPLVVINVPVLLFIRVWVFWLKSSLGYNNLPCLHFPITVRVFFFTSSSNRLCSVVVCHETAAPFYPRVCISMVIVVSLTQFVDPFKSVKQFGMESAIKI